MESLQGSTGVFLNGKAQIVEMLQFMPNEEREVLLKNIRLRNPSLADELVVGSYTFDQIDRLTDHELNIIFRYVSAPILGVALKDVSKNLQRRLLSIAPRPYAEEAYNILITPLSNEKRDIKRAQNKVVNIIVTLMKRKQLQLH